MTYYFDNVYINNKYSYLGNNKYNTIVKDNVDDFVDDYYLNEKTVELAEGKYQENTIKGLLNKSYLTERDVSILISSDLQNQNFASNMAASKYKIPFLGIYSACASFCEGLIIASNFIENNNQNIIVTCSSHNLVSEKQFRFPVEYGAVRKMVNSLTVSGSVSALVSSKESNIKIESATIGNVIYTSHSDSNDMGSAMAPSCAEVLKRHLKDTNRSSDYYDLILTGDLGEYGVQIMKTYFKKISRKTLNNVVDSGSIFYQDKNIYAGGSGPTCLPLVLFDYILPMKKYNKILIIATGSLHSVLSSNLKVPMRSVSHVVSLEVKY